MESCHSSNFQQCLVGNTGGVGRWAHASRTVLGTRCSMPSARDSIDGEAVRAEVDPRYRRQDVRLARELA